MNLLREYIREMLTEANEYGWKPASRKTMKLDKDGMEQSDKDNQEKYLKSMGLMENTYDIGFIMKITRKQLRRIIAEALELDLEKGDVILTGRFKNKRTIVKKISTDDLGQPTINGMKALSFRIEKLMPKSKWSKKTLEELEEDEE